jgi:hypothetical protein
MNAIHYPRSLFLETISAIVTLVDVRLTMVR